MVHIWYNVYKLIHPILILSYAFFAVMKMSFVIWQS